MAENMKSVSFTRAIAIEFDKQEDCDVFFCINGKTIGAHKFMLKLRCQVLYEMSMRRNARNEPICIEYDTFKAVLKYIYTGELSLTDANVLSFLSASVKLAMQKLEEFCCDYISKSLNPKRVCSYMTLAIDFGSAALQNRCCSFFSKRTWEILRKQTFIQLSQPALAALLGVHKANVMEFELFKEVKKWMERRCKALDLPVDGTNMRKVIGNGLYKIRFPTMTEDELQDSLAKIEGIFLTEREKEQIRMRMIHGSTYQECPFSNEYRYQSTEL